jgi:hypothetical protein
MGREKGKVGKQVKDEEEFAEDRDMFLQEYPDSTLFA